MAKPRKASDGPTCLAFVGDGSHYIPGVPTDTLHDVPASQVEDLVDSGLYKVKPSCDHEAVAEALAAPQAPAEPTEEPTSADDASDDEGDH